ncbi:unnamed protein product [Effrenium voratum]|nr:unnamed protein product [Effrenium voratum]CAJ1415607.1 unnamed protein product [Effrenium voratum]
MAVACAPRKLLREVDDKSETDKTPSMESRDTSPGSSSTKVDEEPDSDSIRSYPFPADVKLKFRESSINVIRHHCRQHPAGTKAIVLFLPGVHGGVGPCRKPGRDYDKNCLYAMVARRLQRKDAPVDIYRCSWPYMCPQMKNAIGGVCHALHCALIQAPWSGEFGTCSFTRHFGHGLVDS